MQFIVLVFFLLSSKAETPARSPYKIVSLYHKDALVTERFLPFQIVNLNNELVSVESVYAEKPCSGMVDPHRAHIALFFCTEETTNSFSVFLRDGGQLRIFKTPEFSVRKVALLSSTPNPDKPREPDSPGKILYNGNCASCHTASNKMVETTTVTHLKNLFAGKVKDKSGNVIESMTKFNNFFSDSQLNDLVKYINEEL
jgi:hypothetical protein